jgi:hypothetical protein
VKFIVARRAGVGAAAPGVAPGAARAELRFGHRQVELGQLPLAAAVGARRAIRCLDLEPAEVAAAQLEVVDDDVERRDRRRLCVEQPFDPFDFALGQAQAREAAVDPAGAARAAPRGRYST